MISMGRSNTTSNASVIRFSMNCPICNSKASFKFKSHLERIIYQCTFSGCNHLFIQNYLTETGICEEKDRDFDLSFKSLSRQKARRIKLYHNRNVILFQDIINNLKFDAPLKVLDVGSGDGSIAHSLNCIRPKPAVTCFEPHDVFQSFLHEEKVEIITDLYRQNDSYDLIILNEVIEHINDPLMLLNQLSIKLRSPNSVLFIATPLGMSHNRSLKTAAYNTYSHLHFFTRESLNIALIRSGFLPLVPFTLDAPIYMPITNSHNSRRNPISFKQIKAFAVNKVKKQMERLYPIMPVEHVSGIAYGNTFHV